MFKTTHIGIQWDVGRGDAFDESRAEDAALAVFKAADVDPVEAEVEYMRQWADLDGEGGMTGSALVYIAARAASNAAATEGWYRPEGGMISIWCEA